MTFTPIQREIRKTIRASATSLRPIVNCFKIAKYALEASDESLELSCHAGELALHQCYFDRIARSPLAKRPCGYLKTMEADILSVSTLALLVTTTDLNTVPMPDRFAPQLLYHYAIIGAADSAYITQTEKIVSHDSPNWRQQVSQKPERFSQGPFACDYSIWTGRLAIWARHILALPSARTSPY
ncbi:hypothetical protein K438DRAFT_2016398 [Mycena galopus ATCC 62051]|nr:hypothetical protein K438DRAFT_2016398 [Mycena galopus ATCC 62051]